MKTMIKVIMFAALAAVTTISNAAPANSSDKPFAEKHVVLQISDPNPFKQTLVLNVAKNLIDHYGQDKVDVEIVAFGPGLRLLLNANTNKGRISGLSSEGVRFSACGNTINAMTKQLGHPPVMNPQAKVVPGGAVRIIDLVADGYTLIKP
jgi:intracellular sulfur oxidation DsrE/DsrF family protein